jgi:hypothetical protein
LSVINVNHPAYSYRTLASDAMINTNGDGVCLLNVLSMFDTMLLDDEPMI